ncbi:MAG: RAMP superfamily CRISPR-associated protein [Candidatus Nanopelagicales bacterium]
MSQRILTVVEVAEQGLHFVDWNNGRGGPRQVLPVDSWMVDPDDRDTEVGDVLRADAAELIAATRGEGIAILAFLGTARRVRTTRAAGALGVEGTAVDLEVLGLHREDAPGLARSEFWVLDSPNDALGVGHFEHADSALDEWKRDQVAKAARARNSFRVTKFFNPYNFVPVPESAAPRSAPAGHLERTAGSLSGRISVSVTAVTPLLIRTGDPEDPPRRDGSPFIPASALKGSLRSLHETLTGSCYRVVDLDYTPGYRDLLQADNKSETAGWRLAVVDEVDRFGKPTSFRVCDKVVWTQFAVLQEAYENASVSSGDQVRIEGEPQRNTRKGNRF